MTATAPQPGPDPHRVYVLCTPKTMSPDFRCGRDSRGECRVQQCLLRNSVVFVDSLAHAAGAYGTGYYRIIVCGYLNRRAPLKTPAHGLSLTCVRLFVLSNKDMLTSHRLQAP